MHYPIARQIKKLFQVFPLLLISCSHLLALGSRPNPDPNAPPPPAWVQWFPMLVIIPVFYLLMIRPQAKQRKERQNLMDSLKKGDKIVTQGGLIGTVVNVGPSILEVKLNEETKVKILRSGIQEILKDQTEVKEPEIITAK